VAKGKTSSEHKGADEFQACHASYFSRYFILINQQLSVEVAFKNIFYLRFSVLR